VANGRWILPTADWAADPGHLLSLPGQHPSPHHLVALPLR